MKEKNTIYLSKSRYLNGLQCPKMLWLLDHNKDLFDQSVMNERVLEEGNKVGDLARQYFNADVTIPYNPDSSVMIAETQKYLQEKKPVIAEATFQFEKNMCRVDILQVFDGYVEMVEVKGSTDLKELHLDDLSYQYYVLSSAGLQVKKASLMHINNRYIRSGELNLDELFVIKDCTEIVQKMQKSTEENIAQIKASQDYEPLQDIGPHCSDPYDCGFSGHCWKHIPEHSVFDISRLRNVKKFYYYRQGIISFDQVLESGIDLKEKQLRQVQCEVENLPPSIDHHEINSFLENLTYPLYFLDFETYMTAIPQFDGTSPYMQIPFQYSLHILSEKGGTLEHREFLAKEGTDPRRPLAEQLCRDIPRGVCVIAYNMGFEKRVINKLAEYFPDLSGQLLNINDCMKDIMRPFQTHAYYRREFAGSYSIKAVLPALYPDDKDLDYRNLNLIQGSVDAMDAFPNLHEKPPEVIAQIREALLAYCRLDTLGMVKILWFLEGLVGEFA